MIPWYAWLLIAYVATWATIPSVLLSNKRPASMLAWIGATFALPFLGPLLYLVLGTDRLRRKRLKRLRAPHPQQIETQLDEAVDRFSLSEVERALFRGISVINGMPPAGVDSLEVHTEADSYYNDFIESIRAARRHVHCEVYAWRDDDIGRRFLDELTAAASRGVEVRLLIDELGSLAMTEDFFRPLVEAGGEFSWFYTIHPRRNRYFLNLRNHRKLQIVDGACAYVGGMNIGREYTGRDPVLGDWKDLQVRVTGGLVNQLQGIFCNDWYFATEKEFKGRDYYPKPSNDSTMPAQLIESGPDLLKKPFLKSFLLLTAAAQSSIDLFTPYFVPVSSMVYALQVAAARGVRVRIMLSEKNDHRFLVTIGRSYYAELMSFGVEIYEYSEAIHHAKAVIVDDTWLMVGSANLDVRSIDLNFELNIVLRAPEACTELNTTYADMFEKSSRLDSAVFARRSRWEKLGEGVCRLCAPLL